MDPHYPSLIFFLPLLLIILLPSSTTAQPAFLCSNGAGNYTAGSTYSRNLNNLLTSMASPPDNNNKNRSTTGFFNISTGRASDRAHGIGLCRGDLAPADCRACISNATRRILQVCPTQKQAVGWYESCMVRYSNRSIYGVLDPDPPFFYMWNFDTASDPTRFNASLLTLLTRLRTEAAAGSSVEKFATGTELVEGNETRIYGLAQCSPDLSRQLCSDCLDSAILQIPMCCDGRTGGRVMNTNCNFRYETFQFYADADVPAPAPAMLRSPPSVSSLPPPSVSSPPPPPTGDGGSKNTSWVVVHSVIPILAAVALGFLRELATGS